MNCDRYRVEWTRQADIAGAIGELEVEKQWSNYMRMGQITHEFTGGIKIQHHRSYIRLPAGVLTIFDPEA